MGQIMLSKKLHKQRRGREHRGWCPNCCKPERPISDVWKVVSVEAELHPFFEQMERGNNLKAKLKPLHPSKILNQNKEAKCLQS